MTRAHAVNTAQCAALIARAEPAANGVAVSGRAQRRVRAFPTNTVDVYDDEQRPILERCPKLHDKVLNTGTDPFEYAARQSSFRSDTVAVIYKPAP